MPRGDGRAKIAEQIEEVHADAAPADIRRRLARGPRRFTAMFQRTWLTARLGMQDNHAGGKLPPITVEDSRGRRGLPLLNLIRPPGLAGRPPAGDRPERRQLGYGYMRAT